MKERDGISDEAWRHQHEICEQLTGTMMESPVPVIAAANGKAFGGGLEMILAAENIVGNAPLAASGRLNDFGEIIGSNGISTTADRRIHCLEQMATTGLAPMCPLTA